MTRKLRSRVRCAIVGCGDVAGQYVRTLRSADVVDLVSCHDVDRLRGEAFSAQHRLIHVPDLDDLLTGPHDVIINLTPAAEHAVVTRRAIRAGKSVYSEWPLALEVGEAEQLLAEAEAAGVFVGCAPDTFLGPIIQAAVRAIEAGDIGEPVGASMSMLSPSPGQWHREPERYGPPIRPLIEMGADCVTTLVGLLGPIARVTGACTTTIAERRTLSRSARGQTIRAEVPTLVLGVMEFAWGQHASVIVGSDVHGTQTPYVEIHGTDGSIVVPNPKLHDASVRLRRSGSADWHNLAGPHSGLRGPGLGVVDLSAALLDHGPQRAAGRIGLHVLEVLRAIEQASQASRSVAVQSRCPRPESVS